MKRFSSIMSILVILAVGFSHGEAVEFEIHQLTNNDYSEYVLQQ